MAGGACVAVGKCVAGRGMHGRGHAWWGVCMAGGHTWQLLRDTVNERAEPWKVHGAHTILIRYLYQDV